MNIPQKAGRQVNAGNLSEPDSFLFLGVGIDLEAPSLEIIDMLYQPDSLQVVCSENGILYLVLEGTSDDLSEIRLFVIDSLVVVGDSAGYFLVEELSNGEYWLYASDTVGNLSGSYEFTIMGVGLTKSDLGNDMLIYPNPVNDLIYIQTNVVDEWTATLLSLEGHILYYQKINGNFLQVDFSALKEGVYLLILRSGAKMWSEKILKK